ncbi:MAG: HAD family hydrolase [Polyangiales bacterium]
MFDAVVFDLDGTLVDSIGDVRRALRDAWSHCVPGAEFPEERLRIGPPLDRLIAALDPTLDEAARARLATEFRARYDRCGFEETTPYHGVERILEALGRRGVPCHVATNKRRVATEAIVHRRFPGRFASVSCLGPPFASKADMLRSVVAAGGLSSARVAMIGDTAEDVAAAKDAGARAIAVTWGYGDTSELLAASPDHVAHDAATLSEVLGV